VFDNLPEKVFLMPIMSQALILNISQLSLENTCYIYTISFCIYNSQNCL